MNSIEAPSYKLVRFIGRKLCELMELPYTYSTKNSKQVAQQLAAIQFNNHCKMNILDIIDLYVNLPIQDIQCVPLATEPGISLTILPLMRILLADRCSVSQQLGAL